MSVPNSAYANFRYNNSPIVALNQPALGVLPLTGTNTVGMDEDYDACDLENWFLAIQSADGQVIIPSFHRPANIRIDPNNGINDWTRPKLLRQPRDRQTQACWAESASRILRPCQADGNDAATFPDLVPDPTTGQITYDVDNDGDGVTDSVWLDLGYPLKRDSSGKFYKPLFAFMVIGLNGKIPLNTAGNLAGFVAGVQNPPSNSEAGATTATPAVGRGRPFAPPGQLGQRDRPDLRAPECVRRRDQCRPGQRRRPVGRILPAACPASSWVRRRQRPTSSTPITLRSTTAASTSG